MRKRWGNVLSSFAAFSQPRLPPSHLHSPPIRSPLRTAIQFKSDVHFVALLLTCSPPCNHCHSIEARRRRGLAEACCNWRGPRMRLNDNLSSHRLVVLRRDCGLCRCSFVPRLRACPADYRRTSSSARTSQESGLSILASETFKKASFFDLPFPLSPSSSS